MRLIDADALWTDIMMLPHNEDMISSEEVELAIMDAPTVDAVEVVHARWIKRPYERICPVCKDRHSYYGWAEWNFCKNCGAKMDGGNEDG